MSSRDERPKGNGEEPDEAHRASDADEPEPDEPEEAAEPENDDDAEEELEELEAHNEELEAHNEELEAHNEELEAHNEELRARVADLEKELASSHRAASGTRWAAWILGTFAVAAALAVVVIFLGEGIPSSTSGAAVSPPSELTEAEQQAALFAVLEEHADELQSCFDDWVEGSRPERGTIVQATIEVEANEGGAVERAEVSGDVPSDFAACLERSVSRWTFPGPGQFALQAPFQVRESAAQPGARSAAGAASADAGSTAETDVEGGAGRSVNSGAGDRGP